MIPHVAQQCLAGRPSLRACQRKLRRSERRTGQHLSPRMSQRSGQRRASGLIHKALRRLQQCCRGQEATGVVRRRADKGQPLCGVGSVNEERSESPAGRVRMLTSSRKAVRADVLKASSSWSGTSTPARKGSMVAPAELSLVWNFRSGVALSSRGREQIANSLERELLQFELSE